MSESQTNWKFNWFLALIASMTCLLCNTFTEASYTQESAITKPTIDTPAFTPYWETDTTHTLYASGASDNDCDLSTGNLVEDSVSYYWTTTHGTFVGVNYGDTVDYKTPTAYVTDHAEITVLANDDYAYEGNSALYDDPQVASDPLEVIVVEITDLNDSVAEDEYAENEGSSHNIPGGDLRLYKIRLSNVDLSSDRDTQWSATLNESTGAVSVSLLEEGPFLMETSRYNGTTVVADDIEELLYDSPPGKDGPAKKTGKTKSITKPNQDLIAISSSGNDNNWLVYARASIAGEEAIGSVQDVINEINAHWAANGNNTFTLGVIDHGKSGLQSMGDGDITIAGKFIDNLARSAADRNNFINACKNKVTTLTLYGCNVADGADGSQLLSQLSNGANITVKAHTGSVYCSKSGKWSASDLGNVVTVTPTP